MGSNNIPVVPLSSGNVIPLVGLGTCADPLIPKDLKQAVLKAIELGYRHFDTASLYKTEIPLGEAIREALELGLINSREELFVTSKLWLSEAHPGHVLPALQNSLRNLGFEYLDLYLMHYPASSKPGKHDLYPNKEELMPIDLGGVWKDMEECQKLGLTKSIGVSNFACKKLQTLLDLATIPPAANQVEMNPFWQQKKLREFCKEKGIHISAYSPLAAYKAPWGSSRVMECDALAKIAEAKGKTIAQVCLRWAYEQGVSVIVKSFSEERMRENLGIFDWKLSDEDYEKIEKIPQAKGFSFSHITGDDCPYKSVDELWDGEI